MPEKRPLIHQIAYWIFVSSCALTIVFCIMGAIGALSPDDAIQFGILSTTGALCSGIIGLPALFDQFGKIQVEGVPHVVQDELDDLQNGRITRPIVNFIATLSLILYFVIQALHYNKLGNAYYTVFGLPIHTLIFTAIFGTMIWTSIKSTCWYHDKSDRIGTRWYAFVAIGIFLSILLGTYMTEPITSSGMTQSEVDGSVRADAHGYTYGHTRSYVFYHTNVEPVFSSPSPAPSSAGAPTVKLSSCGKSCGKGLAFALIFALVVLAVVASAFVPHFWFMIVPILLIIYWLLTKHDLKRNRAYD